MKSSRRHKTKLTFKKEGDENCWIEIILITIIETKFWINFVLCEKTSIAKERNLFRGIDEDSDSVSGFALNEWNSFSSFFGFSFCIKFILFVSSAFIKYIPILVLKRTVVSGNISQSSRSVFNAVKTAFPTFLHLFLNLKIQFSNLN